MVRIDLFTSRQCAACPEARKLLADLTRRRGDVEVVEWDLERDPGPAVGRGIFVTPSLLIDGHEILYGVPTLEELEKRIGAVRGPDADGQDGHLCGCA